MPSDATASNPKVHYASTMDVTLEIVGEDEHTFEVTDETYGDLLAALDINRHLVTVMVDGRPVPEDQPVDTDHVRVVRLIKGGRS